MCSSTLRRAEPVSCSVRCGFRPPSCSDITCVSCLPECHPAHRLKHAGAHVIGTVSTPEKAELAKQNGAEHVFIYTKETLSDVIQNIKAVTPGGEGVHAVLDGVGKDTFESGFEVARRKATLVTFGNASGAVEPFAPLKLAAKNLKGESAGMATELL